MAGTGNPPNGPPGHRLVTPSSPAIAGADAGWTGPGRTLAAVSAANLLRRAARRAFREFACRWWRTSVRPAAPSPGGAARVRVQGWPPGRSRRHQLNGTGAGLRLRGGRLTLRLPDLSALTALAGSGLLSGEVRRLDLVLASVAGWQLAGARPPRPGSALAGFRWHRRDHRVRLELRWWHPYPVDRALAEATAAVQAPRPWVQLSGDWPPADQPGLPDPLRAGPDPLRADPGAGHPYGRILVGAATPYRLVPAGGGLELRDAAGRAVALVSPGPGPAAALVRGKLAKYAVVRVDEHPGDDPGTGAVLRVLAGCGMVFAAAAPALRAGLKRHGLVPVPDPGHVADLPGYAASVAGSRRAAIAGDPVLSRSALAGGPAPVPTVTAVVSSMRAGQLPALFDCLARQQYPALEVVVGLHGYTLPPAQRQELVERLPFPVRLVPLPAAQPFGAVLGQLTRMADGELVTKLDDDDHYGRNHVTDLVLAWRTTGAELVAKGARFVHFPERAETVDRTWAAPEVFDVTPAGGTLLLSRGTLAEVGGWSHARRHVDADLLARIRSAGGLIYRTHALEYVYVRRSSGHTFVAASDELRAQGEATYPGLPRAIIDPDHPDPHHQEPTDADSRHAGGGVLRQQGRGFDGPGAGG